MGFPQCFQSYRRVINKWLSNIYHKPMILKGEQGSYVCNIQSKKLEVSLLNVMIKLPHDLNKEKGHVFEYEGSSSRSFYGDSNPRPTLSAPEHQRVAAKRDVSPDEHNSSANFQMEGSNGFQNWELLQFC